MDPSNAALFRDFADQFAKKEADVRRVIERAGGWQQVQETARLAAQRQASIEEAVEKAGGWQHVQHIAQQQADVGRLIEQAGGWQRIQETAEQFVRQQADIQEVLRQGDAWVDVDALLKGYATRQAQVVEALHISDFLSSAIANHWFYEQDLPNLQNVAFSDQVQEAANNAMQAIAGATDEDPVVIIDNAVTDLVTRSTGQEEEQEEEREKEEEEEEEEAGLSEKAARLAVWMVLAPLLLVLWNHPLYADWVQGNFNLAVTLILFTKWAWQKR